jgi:phage shock protein A
MSRLEQAARRLEQAVARLETAAQRANQGAASRSTKPDHAALADATATVARRLDAMIGRIDRVLEG